ncbi:hypothetical protein GMDG_00352 [Pseudogymnoascus destructans 20631-21]|uniref:Uncharacterized protein n=1 Tax=Pseudogymnoascus destructans (strain ATCC MYA-4855 / 20631-21) TaxID=658429 RepID=L8G0E5_PSED2|nr:hypothetical protein GMDG_00352 [Pseudogymnoascus destructans 20631-21]
METPSQPTLSRIALGALDVNKHLNSPLGSPKKSPVKKHNFVFTDDGAEQAPVARSMKERLLETEVPVLRETPVRVVEAQVSPRSEKRKEAPTDVGGREEERVKVARIEGREMGGLGLASELGGWTRWGWRGTRGWSQLKQHPFAPGHHQLLQRFHWGHHTQQPSPPPTQSPTPQENHPPRPPKLTPPTPSSARTPQPSAYA